MAGVPNSVAERTAGAAVNQAASAGGDAQQAATKETQDPSEILEWDAKYSSYQAKLVDLLQIALRLRHAHPARLAIVISAWDRCEEKKLQPEAWIKARLPKLYQYLLANADVCEFAVFGVSTQWAELKSPGELLDTIRASDRIKVVRGLEESKDLTLPIQFSAGGCVEGFGNMIQLGQTLHGYQDGHSLLASSQRLLYAAESTLLVLSDPSGQSFVSGFDAYLTGYPLAEANIYALAKIWYAPEMERPGCVWTHTLLLKFGDLARFSDLSILPRCSMALAMATSSGASISVNGRAPSTGRMSFSIRRQWMRRGADLCLPSSVQARGKRCFEMTLRSGRV